MNLGAESLLFVPGVGGAGLAVDYHDAQVQAKVSRNGFACVQEAGQREIRENEIRENEVIEIHETPCFAKRAAQHATGSHRRSLQGNPAGAGEQRISARRT